MLSTRIFGQTFRSFQGLISRNQKLQQKILNVSRNPYTQFHVGNMYAMTNLISQQLSQLQSQHVMNLLQKYHNVTTTVNNRTCSHFDTDINYDEKSYFFTIHRTYHLNKTVPIINTIQQLQDMKLSQKNSQNQQLQSTSSNKLPLNIINNIQKFTQQKEQLQVKIKIKNCQQQKIDHPSVRQTLYFHELKDLDKYIKYQFLPKTPLFIQDMNRKKLQMKVLDQKNPYGYPLKAPPLIFDIQLQNKVFITIKSTYEETNITQVGTLKNNKRFFKISGMKLPRNLQKMLFQDVITSILNIDQTQILNIHKLAYLGGRVQKLNVLMSVHEVMDLENQTLFDQKLALL